MHLHDSVNLSLGTGDDMTLGHDGLNSSIISITGDFYIYNQNVTGKTINRLRTSTSATAFEVHDISNTALFSVKGDGATSFTGSLTVDDIKIDGSNIGHTSDTDLLGLTPNQLVVNGNVNINNGLDVIGAAITSTAGMQNSGGEVLFSGGNVQFNDNIVLSIGNWG